MSADKYPSIFSPQMEENCELRGTDNTIDKSKDKYPSIFSPQMEVIVYLL